MIIRSRRLSRGWRNRPTTIQATSAFPGAPTSPKWKSTLKHVQLVNYTTVDDVGTVINPMIVEGQLHGEIVQGIGQALYENCVYNSASGQLLSGSFMDYCMPRAENLPTLRVSTHSTPRRAHADGSTGPSCWVQAPRHLGPLCWAGRWRCSDRSPCWSRSCLLRKRLCRPPGRSSLVPVLR